MRSTSKRGYANVYERQRAQWKEDRPVNDGSRRTAKVTAGLDFRDKYSCLCLIDTNSGKVVEEDRLCTTFEALRRGFDSEQRMTSPSRWGPARPG
jgi:hypothetical protein